MSTASAYGPSPTKRTRRTKTDMDAIKAGLYDILAGQNPATVRGTRLAVLPHQIEDLDLPTRPTKRSDSRSKSFEGESVEVDAIPAPVLREMVSDAIVSHVDTSELDALLRIEEAERETMRSFVSTLSGGAA